MMMPLTWNITNGIGAGFLVYTLIRLVRGKRDHWMMYVASVAFLIYFLQGFLRTLGVSV